MEETPLTSLDRLDKPLGAINYLFVETEIYLSYQIEMTLQVYERSFYFTGFADMEVVVIQKRCLVLVHFMIRCELIIHIYQLKICPCMFSSCTNVVLYQGKLVHHPITNNQS